jgi:uncharacterized membrane protein YphA (DoxX/SURF4 family)
MMSPTTSTRLERSLHGLLGLLMLWAAVSKLANPTTFLGSIFAYELPLPQLVLRLAAVILPWVEFLCGLLLLTGFWLRTTLLLVATLLGVFVLATGQAWGRGLDISCGCFDLTMLGLPKDVPGVARFLDSVGFAFFRNLLLTGIAVLLLRRQMRTTPA